MLNIHGTVTESSVLIASTVHVLSTMGLFVDMQSAEDLPPNAAPIHSTTVMQRLAVTRIQHFT